VVGKREKEGGSGQHLASLLLLEFGWQLAAGYSPHAGSVKEEKEGKGEKEGRERRFAWVNQKKLRHDRATPLLDPSCYGDSVEGEGGGGKGKEDARGALVLQPLRRSAAGRGSITSTRAGTAV